MSWIREKLFKRTVLDLAIIAIAAGLMVVPMLVNGIPAGNDLPHHYRFALQINESLQQGVIYPSWGGIANHGFGDVGIRFYPPLSYYAMNSFHAVTDDWYFASILTFFFLLLVGGIGVYLWSLEWFDETSSLVAAIAYLVMPYHVNQIYNAFLYAEFAAAAIIPFCFLFATRLCRKPNAENIILLAASYEFLILTHLPTALIASAGLAIYALFSLPKNERLKTALTFAAAIFLGLLASGFYLIRIFTETAYLKHAAPEFASGDFGYSRNFLLSYFYAGSEDYLSRSLWFGDLMLGLTLLASIPILIIYFRSRKSESRKAIFASAVVFIISLFFASPLSSILWSRLPLLAKIQFPFRWMSLITLVAAIFIAAGFRHVAEMFASVRRPIALATFGGIALTIAFTAFQIMRPARFVDRHAFESTIATLKSSPSCECWWPIWAKKSAFENPELVTANERAFTTENWESNDRTFHSSEGPAAVVRIATFYYPNWTAIVNGKATATNVADDGTILIELPEGSVDVSLIFKESFSADISRIISLLIFSFFLAFILFRLIRNLPGSKTLPDFAE
jgi:uncharacterized membrane protein